MASPPPRAATPVATQYSAPAPAQASASPRTQRDADALLPPDDIPTGRARPQRRGAEPNFFEKLFGG
jgi:hypothetical protein